jgi:glyoxylase-like metal-dependent hydrolase (beta-lactamase superfamily II)
VLLDGSPSAAAAASGGLPEYAPIPGASFGPTLNEHGYYVGRVKGNLFWVTDGVYQSLILSTRAGIVLVDAPPSIGHNLIRAIETVTRITHRPSKTTHLVYSHSHADHIGASSLFGKSVVRIAHEETRKLLKFDNDPNRPLPQITFRDHHVLEVGGERIELRYHGPNHTTDNIVIHLPAYQTLMVVDVLFPGRTPFFNLAITADIPAWYRAHDLVMDYPWTTYVGGHMGRLGTRGDGELQRSYVRDLEVNARKAIAELDITPYYTKYVVNGGNTWALVREYFGAVARRAAEPVIEAYSGRLAAVDVLTESHALVLVESLRVNGGLLSIQQ